MLDIISVFKFYLIKILHCMLYMISLAEQEVLIQKLFDWNRKIFKGA